MPTEHTQPFSIKLTAVEREIAIMTIAIVMGNGGQAQFNFTEAHKIMGCGINKVAHELHKAGVLIKKSGHTKRVSAYDLATYILKNRVAPIDNTSR